MSRVRGGQAGTGKLERISFQTLEVWNIERAGTVKSIELIAIFNVQGRDNRIVYHLYDSKNNVISEGYPRIYNKGEALYPKFFETQTPDGIVRMEAYLVDENNHRISNIPVETLYLKKAQPASGIGQRALEDPTFNLPEFPEAIREASITAQNPELISAKVQRDILQVYVWPEEARAAVSITEPAAVTITEPLLPEISILPEVYAEPEPEPIVDQVTTNMIRQELLNFTIVNNRIQGSIKFIATDAFNPYYYNKPITTYLQLKSKGFPIESATNPKSNRLTFTETERDEVITFDEDAQNLTFVTAESFIDPGMSEVLTFTIEAGKEATTTKTGFMGAGVLGLIGILMLGGFIADHVRKRK